MRLTAPRQHVAQMVPRGSIAIDGVSLTLVSADNDEFSVALIPSTLARTNLGELATGCGVNIELDLIGKYVRRFLQQIGGEAPGGRLTLEKLRDAGFA